MKKKICYLADASNPHVKKWCDYFLKMDYEIHCISLNGGEIDGVTVHNFQTNVNEVRNEKIYKKTSYLSNIKKIKKLVREIKPDILHAQYASSYGFIGSLIGYHPYVVSVWGTDIYDFPRNGFIQKKIIKHNFKKADYIFSNSVDMAREANLYTDKKVYVTFFGVDMKRFKPIEVEDSGYYKIGIIKSLEKKYGIKYLVDAFSQILKKYNGEVRGEKLKLVIGGSGKDEINLKEKVKKLGIENSVEFLGRVKSEDICRTFNSFKFSVFPSLREGFGVAAIESEACETPVIITDVGGHKESVDPDKSGLVVNSESSEELVEAMSTLIDDEKKREEMGKYGRKFVRENYEVNDNFYDISLIYNKILEEKNK